MSRRLFLVVRRRGAKFFTFPSAARSKGESLITCAIKELFDNVGKALYVYPVSALPTAHWVAPVARKDEGRVFFFRGELLAGDVALQADSYDAHAWVTLWEMEKMMEPEVFRAVRGALRAV